RCARRLAESAPRSEAKRGIGPLSIPHRGGGAPLSRDRRAAADAAQVRRRERAALRVAARREMASVGADHPLALRVGAARSRGPLVRRHCQARRRAHHRAQPAGAAPLDAGGGGVGADGAGDAGGAVITPGLWRRSLRAGAQWRLLALWLFGVALP